MEQVHGRARQRSERHQLTVVAGHGIPVALSALCQHPPEHFGFGSVSSLGRGEPYCQAAGIGVDPLNRGAGGEEGRALSGTELDGDGRPRVRHQPGHKRREPVTRRVDLVERLELEELLKRRGLRKPVQTPRDAQRVLVGERLCSAGHTSEGVMEFTWDNCTF